ncbi:MAG TPA: aldose epimerase family protein [Candidatus Limiplasma sp.]|nr:aldose epimerase family protein [Candidatus Limiplasma sp.]HPS81978.1 aldose epimerase family protein [Candidatus Limiplasma sp.]
MSITTKPYGNEHHGKPVTEYTLTNASGASVSILDFGGVITRINVPDREGALGDVNLGYDDAMAYTADSGSMGALIGRVGNRISGAEFDLDGQHYTLGTNDGPNNLHGGPEGFNLRMWQAEPLPADGTDALRLTLVSPDGDQGFPGELRVTVTYSFDNHNALGIDYRATTTKTTLVNLTNHAYFNLDGHETPTVQDQVLQVFAGRITAVRKGLIPTGEMVPQTDVVYGFETPKRLGDVLNNTATDPFMKAAKGVDFNYCAGYDRIPKCIAILYSPKTGREMKVITDLPGVQVYTGQGLHQTGKDGVRYQPYSGICLETQRYPDAIHQPYFPSIVLRPEEVYVTKTEYVFGVR